MSLRRLRGERTASIAFAGLVLVTAFVVAATPRILDRVSDDAFRTALASASPGAADVELVQERRIPASLPTPLASVANLTSDLESRLPPGIRSLVDARYHVAETPFWSVLTETPENSTVALRIQEGLEQNIRYVAGRSPTASVRQTSLAPAAGGAPLDVVVFEAALAASSAAALGVSVGDTLLLAPDPYDPLAGRSDAPFGATAEGRLAIDVVGTWEPVDATHAYWSSDLTVVEPRIRSINSEVEFLAAVAVLSSDAYPALLEETAADDLPMRYRWRYLVDEQRVEAERTGELIADLRRMEGLFPATPGVSPIEGTLLRSSLLPLAEQHAGRWRSAETVLAVAGIGAAAAAVAAMALVALLAAQRRGTTLTLWTARGASGTQILAGTVVEGLVVAAPPALLAAALAIFLITAGATIAAALAAGAVLAATLVLLLAMVARVARSPLDDPARRPRASRRPTARRLLLEAVLVAGAVIGAALLRERGVRGASSAGTLAAADPLIAAVPVLVGLAAGVVAIRVFPRVISILARVARVRRDLVPMLGLVRATREGGTAAVLLVLMMAATIGAFSAATLAYVDRAAEDVAWHQVGGSFRLTSTTGFVPDDLDLEALPDVEAAARIYRAPATTRDGARFVVVVVDAASFADVVRGTPLDPGLPGALSDARASPLPAVVSAALADAEDGIAVGETFGAAIRGTTIEFHAVAARDSFPTVEVGTRFAVVSREQIEAIAGAALPTHAVILRSPDDAATALRESLAELDPAVVVESRAERTAAFRASPVPAAVIVGLLLAMAVTAAYAALAVALALAVAGAARSAEVAHLRALGLSSRQAFGLVLAEHAPTVLIGFGAGTALGLALFAALEPGLGLAALIGTALSIPVLLDAGQLALIFAAMIIISALGIGLSAALQRTSIAASAVRRGIE